MTYDYSVYIMAASLFHFNITIQTAYDNFVGLSTLRTRSFRYIILLILPLKIN